MNNFEFKFFSAARQDVVRIVMLMVILIIADIKAQELKITSLIDQPILILEKHNCKIQIGNINIIHEVNITEIENTMHLLTQVAFRPTNSPLSIIAKHKVRNLYSNFNLIRPRKRLIRSVEAIGSVWKWIGGSPDAHDLQIINSTMNDLIESNNQQFVVNENLGMKIKNLTKEMKQMIENRNDILLNELDMLTAIINIDTINKILEDIQEAISLSKMSITSSKLLSPREIAIIQQLLEDQGVKSDIPDEIISYVTPKIAVNNNKLLYILKVPELQKEESKVIEILALNHNNSLIKDYPRQLVKQKKKLYTTKNPEKYVQKYSDIMDFFDNCIAPLVMGKESHCLVVPENETTAKMIGDNQLLIENAKDHLVTSDCGPNDRLLNGNFLLTFSNCTIQFRNKSFTSEEIHVKSPAVYGTVFNIAIHRKVVETPLASLDDRTLTNRKHIEHIYLQQYKNITWNWSLLTGLGVSTTVSIAIIIFVYFYFSRFISAISNQIEKRKSRSQKSSRNHRRENNLEDSLNA